MMNAREIKKWMRANVERFREIGTSEYNATGLVEAWDIECADGSATLDPNHSAWDIAVTVTETGAHRGK